jgi:hypothetical protein
VERLGTIDPRVEGRAVSLYERLVATGSVVLRKLGGNRAGEVAAQRLLSSPSLSLDWILDSASARTREVCAGRRVVVAQDTTEINFASSARRKGLGPGGNGKTPGFFIHALVAVDPAEEAVLGLVGAEIWTRAREPVNSRKSRPIEEKESQRWLDGALASRRLDQAAQIIVVGDQEADIWAHFARRPPGVELLVRARHDRALAEKGSLFAAPASWPELKKYTITIAPRRIGQKARETAISMRAGTVTILRPETAGAEGPEKLVLGLVEAREIDPPAGCEPVLWRVLTTLPVADAEQAFDVVRLYRLRWRIEEVFRTLKKDGLRLEESQVYDTEHLFRLSAIALAGAVRILQLVDARDGGPRPMSDVLDDSLIEAVDAIGKTKEGATQRQKNPHPRGSLAWLSWIVARYGGWNAYYKPPGPKTMADGWDRFIATLSGYLIATGKVP